MIHFFLMVNKHGQTRLADYFTKHPDQTVESRAAEEAEIVRKCLARKDNQVWLRHASSCATIQTHQILLFSPVASPLPFANGSGCTGRQCSFFEHKQASAETGQKRNPLKVMYRRYASIFFIVGTADEVRVLSCVAAGGYAAASPRRQRGILEVACSRAHLRSLLRGLQNELAILEFIHSFVETLDRYFENVVRA